MRHEGCVRNADNGTGVCGGPVSLYAQSREMDVTQSSLTIRVFKPGVFSALSPLWLAWDCANRRRRR